MGKICTKCGENKSSEDYYKDIRHKDNKMSYCKSCHNGAQRKYYIANRERLLKKSSEYQKTDKGKLTNAKYKKSDKGKITAAKADVKYYKTDKGKLTIARKNKSDKGKLAHVRYDKSDKGKATIARKNHNRRINIQSLRKEMERT